MAFEIAIPVGQSRYDIFFYVRVCARHTWSSDEMEIKTFIRIIIAAFLPVLGTLLFGMSRFGYGDYGIAILCTVLFVIFGGFEAFLISSFWTPAAQGGLAP